MPKVLIIYYSRTGNTLEMANALWEGAGSISEVEVIVKKAEEATPKDVLDCNAIALGSSEISGSIGEPLKRVLDICCNELKGRIDGKPYIAFGNSIMGSKDVINNIEKICSEMGMNKLTNGVVAKGLPSPEFLTSCWDLGNKLARAAIGK